MTHRTIFEIRVRHQYLPEFEKENPQMQVSLRYLAEEVIIGTKH